ncbi:MAG: hypothetical protein KGH74_05015 [Candidatus Micrarchaeota archaeon]|nr:hypothetical protein [Candidatus Micrarchaeota archaeon]
MPRRKKQKAVYGMLVQGLMLASAIVFISVFSAGLAQLPGIAGNSTTSTTIRQYDYPMPANALALFDSAPVLNASEMDFKAIAREIAPGNDVVLDARWGPWVKTLVSANALNVSSLILALNASGTPLTQAEMDILNGNSTSQIVLNQSDQQFVLYVFWSLGINNKNPVITNGMIMHYGGNPYNLASTGGYKPLGMLQLGNLSMVAEDGAQQDMVWRMANESYRPCCDNPTSMPDCNHGAAALGLIELMASQGMNETAMLDSLEKFNIANFPSQYYEDAIFFASHGIRWGAVPPETMLGYSFSSYTGHSRVHQYLSQYGLLPQGRSSGSSCGA